MQKLLGISGKVDAMQRRASEVDANKLSVRLELQADFFAGVFARYVNDKGILDPGDVDEALQAASSVGDDRIQKQTTGHVMPDSFTHGSAQQRSRWFRKGYEIGDIRQGDTFNVANP